jgi:SWI/SNF-related matrix-associated actin-dependent regulator 1 of chromatin subfamily A
MYVLKRRHDNKKESEEEEEGEGQETIEFTGDDESKEKVPRMVHELAEQTRRHLMKGPIVGRDAGDDFKGELRPHQRDALSFLDTNKRALLAADMGLGKTPTSIALMSVVEAKHTLVVCPASLKFNWLSEFQKFMPSSQPVLIKSKKHLIKQLSSMQTIIVSYSLVSNVIDELCSIDWDVMICDEAHYVKNSTAKRSRSIKKISANSERLVLLTGTPAQKHSDLFYLLHILDPLKWRRFFHHKPHPSAKLCQRQFFFGDRYTIPEKVRIAGGRVAYVFKENRRSKELRALTAPYILRQRKDQLLNLPELIKEAVVIGSLNAREQREHNDKMSQIETITKDKGKLYADAFIMEMLRDTAAIKLPAVNSFMATILDDENNAKLIVFFHHKFVADDLMESLTRLNVGFIRVDGSTPMKKRPAMFKNFEHDPATRVGLLSLGACSTGLNLTFCQHVIYAELTFNSIHHVQSEARCHRIGQSKSVLLQYLIMEGSTDTMVMSSLNNKNSTARLVLDGTDDGNHRIDIKTNTKDERTEEGQAEVEEGIQQPTEWVVNHRPKKKAKLQHQQQQHDEQWEIADDSD